MRTVLTIEDNFFFARMYKAVLTPLGCQVLNAGTVQRALEVLAREQAHLVIVDLRLPDGSGLAIVRWIREHPRLRETPVLTITTRASGQSERSAYEAGASAFLAKPVNLESLKAVVSRYIGPATV